jgi:hypothetical protein
LEKSITGRISVAQIMEYNILDSLWIQAVTFAQRCSQKLRMGAVPYSPVLSLAGKNKGLETFIKKEIRRFCAFKVSAS